MQQFSYQVAICHSKSTNPLEYKVSVTDVP